MRVKIKRMYEYKTNENDIEIEGLVFKDVTTKEDITINTKMVCLYNGYDYKESKLKIPETYKGLPVIEIDENTFLGNSEIEYVTIPNSITKIGVGAFAFCKRLKDVVILNTSIIIEKNAFKSCDNLNQLLKNKLKRTWSCVI